MRVSRRLYRHLLLLGLTLLMAGTGAWGGVVEDAEEALQSVPSDQPGQRRVLDPSTTGAGSTSAPSRTGQAGSVSSSAAPSSPTDSSSSRSGSRNPASAGGQGISSASHPESIETPAAESEVAQRRRERDETDNAVTFGGLLLLLILVVLAGIYSRRAGPDD